MTMNEFGDECRPCWKVVRTESSSSSYKREKRLQSELEPVGVGVLDARVVSTLSICFDFFFFDNFICSKDSIDLCGFWNIGSRVNAKPVFYCIV